MFVFAFWLVVSLSVVALKTALSVDEELIAPLMPLAQALLAEDKIDEAKYWTEKYLLHDKNDVNGEGDSGNDDEFVHELENKDDLGRT